MNALVYLIVIAVASFAVLAHPAVAQGAHLTYPAQVLQAEAMILSFIIHLTHMNVWESMGKLCYSPGVGFLRLNVIGQKGNVIMMSYNNHSPPITLAFKYLLFDDLNQYLRYSSWPQLFNNDHYGCSQLLGVTLRHLFSFLTPSLSGCIS